VNNIPEYTVTQLNRSIKNILEEKFQYIKLVGESGPITIANSGHVYFSIKENDEVISCICWKGSYENLNLKLEEGTEYNFFGRITSYSKFGRSVYQLIVDEIEYSGDGSILKLIEERKKEISAKGLFDQKYKKIIPKFPKSIGVLTSSSGSVIHDIIHRIEDRFPLTKIFLFPVPVQGKNSHIEIIDYLNLIESTKNIYKPDTIIFARGGGSLEEMMPFNEPELIERVFECKIPCISAIGHETDYTLLDLVCDLRAPTPTAAAEIAVPDQNQLFKNLSEMNSIFINLLKNKIMHPMQTLMAFEQSTSLISKKLFDTEKKLDQLINVNLKSINSFFDKKKNLIYNFHIKVNDFNPKQKIIYFNEKIRVLNNSNLISIKNKVKFFKQKISLLHRLVNSSSIDKNLKKGYAILQKDKKLIKDIKSLKGINEFLIKMKDGSLIIKK